MILKGRKRHRLVWTVLAVVVPLVFAAGILLRHSEPTNENTPSVERFNAPGDKPKTRTVNTK